jgi:hypothetical protein
MYITKPLFKALLLFLHGMFQLWLLLLHYKASDESNQSEATDQLVYQFYLHRHISCSISVIHLHFSHQADHSFHKHSRHGNVQYLANHNTQI